MSEHDDGRNQPTRSNHPPPGMERDSLDYLDVGRGISRDNPDLVHKLSKHQLIYSMLGLILGLVSILGGVFLLINGIYGSTSWMISMLGAESNLTDAPAGVALFVVGLFMVFVTRYKTKIR